MPSLLAENDKTILSNENPSYAFKRKEGISFPLTLFYLMYYNILCCFRRSRISSAGLERETLNLKATGSNPVYGRLLLKD